MIGSLPPMKGISQYCMSLANALSEIVDLDFISFKKLYPRFLYPGGVDKDDSTSGSEARFRNRDLMHGYNPVTWVRTGLTCDGDLVHLQWWSYFLFPAYLTILLLLKIRRKRVVMTIHNVTPHENARVGRFATRVLLNGTDGIIVHSEANKKALCRNYRIARRRKVFVVPHGVLSAPETSLTPEEARAALGVERSKKIILFFGNIRPYKGLKTLLTAMKEIRTELPEAILVIAGQPWEDWSEYENIIERLGLSKHVLVRTEYIGMKDVPVFFMSADLVVLPYSEFDAQTGVGLMALNYGKPLVITKVGALEDLVDNPIATTEPGDADGLARNIKAILRNPEILLGLAEDSRRLAGKFQWQVIAQKTLDSYRSLLRETNDLQ